MAAVIGSLVVGTDGSHTAAVAVGRAVALARAFDARLSIVSAYEPVPSGRIRGGMPEPPQDVEWALNPREDVLALLAAAEREAREAGVDQAETFARVGDAADAILDVAASSSARTWWSSATRE